MHLMTSNAISMCMHEPIQVDLLPKLSPNLSVSKKLDKQLNVLMRRQLT